MRRRTTHASTPSPLRFWWLARIAIAYVVVAVALSIVTFAWWQGGVRVRDDILARLRAAGAPASVEEINARLDARSTAAAADAGRRLTALALTGRRSTSMQPLSIVEQAAQITRYQWENEHDARAPAKPADVAQLRAIAMTDAAALATWDTLLDGRPIDWGVRYHSPLMSTLLPYLNAARDGGKLLAEAAVLAHADGDDATAVRRLNAILTLAAETARPPTPLVGVLSGGSLVRDDFGADVESIAATLRVGDGPPAARRADVAALIARLLDDAPPHDALRAALQFERLQMPIDAIEHQPATVTNPYAIAGSRPMLRQTYDGPSMRIDAAIRALDAPTLPAAEALAPPEPRRSRDVARVPMRAVAVRDLLLPMVHRAAANFHQQATFRRAWATLLSIRLFEIDRGRVPTTLDELVPAYLPAVPLDVTVDPPRPLWYVNEHGVVAIYVPGTPRANVAMPARPRPPRPTTFSPDLTLGRSRAGDVVIVYRGHALVRR